MLPQKWLCVRKQIVQPTELGECIDVCAVGARHTTKRLPCISHAHRYTAHSNDETYTHSTEKASHFRWNSHPVVSGGWRCQCCRHCHRRRRHRRSKHIQNQIVDVIINIIESSHCACIWTPHTSRPTATTFAKSERDKSLDEFFAESVSIAHERPNVKLVEIACDE